MPVGAAPLPYTPAYVRHGHTLTAYRIAGFVQHGLGLLEARAGRQGTAGGGRGGQRAAAVTVQRTEPRQPGETSVGASSKAAAIPPWHMHFTFACEPLLYVSLDMSVAANMIWSLLGRRRGPTPI